MLAIRRPAWLGSLAGYALAYAGGAAFQKGIGFLLFLWLARVLSVEDYARFGLLFALQAGLATMAGAGIAESTIGLLRAHAEPDGRRRLLDAANGVFLRLAAVSTIAVGAGYLLTIRPGPQGITELLLVLAGGALTAFFALQAVLVRLDEDHGAALALGVGTPLAGIAAALLTFLIRPQVDSFYAGMAVGLALAFAITRAAGLGNYGVALRAPEARAIGRSLPPYLAIGFVTWLAGYGTTYLVEGFFETKHVATFAFIYTLSSIMQLVATSINQVWSPRVFRLAHEMPVAELERINMRFYALQGVVLGAVGGGMLLVAPPLIDLVGGNLVVYRDLGAELAFLLAGYAVSIPWWHTQNYFYVHGRGPSLMRIVLATNLVGLMIWIALMTQLGVMGVYIGFAAMTLLRSIGTWAVARRTWGLRFAWQGPLLALVLIAAGYLGAVAWFGAA